MYESFVTEEGLEKPLSIQYIPAYETTMPELEQQITSLASPSILYWVFFFSQDSNRNNTNV
jgi:hypothetical protein